MMLRSLPSFAARQVRGRSSEGSGGAASAEHLKPPFPIQYAQLCALALDILTIASAGSAMILALIVHRAPGMPPPDLGRLLLLALILYPPVARYLGAYDADALFLPGRALTRILWAWAATILFLGVIASLLQSRIPVLTPVMIGWATGTAAALVLIRLGATLCYREMRRRGAFDQRSAIFGTGPRTSPDMTGSPYRWSASMTIGRTPSRCRRKPRAGCPNSSARYVPAGSIRSSSRCRQPKKPALPMS
jgi:hypothetical protein